MIYGIPEWLPHAVFGQYCLVICLFSTFSVLALGSGLTVQEAQVATQTSPVISCRCDSALVFIAELRRCNQASFVIHSLAFLLMLLLYSL